MIIDERTTIYERPTNWRNWTQKEHELHVHYASNALVGGHAADCDKVTTAINWPTILGRPSCTCGRAP